MHALKKVISASAIAMAMVGAAAADNDRADKVSPDAYELLLENEQVIVLKMVLAPGQADRMHTHMAETVYFERGGKLRIAPEGELAFDVDLKDGQVMWHTRWSHQVTNIGETTVTAIIVEAKPPAGAN